MTARRYLPEGLIGEEQAGQAGSNPTRAPNLHEGDREIENVMGFEPKVQVAATAYFQPNLFRSSLTA